MSSCLSNGLNSQYSTFYFTKRFILNTNFLLFFFQKKGEIKWSFYHRVEDVEKLINSLNERGLRESELKQNLIDYKVRIIEKLNKFPCEYSFVLFHFSNLVSLF